MKVVGYADRLSVPAGAPIEFKISCDETQVATEVVRVLRGGSDIHEVALVEERVSSSTAHGVPSEIPGRVQTTVSGSYAEARTGAEAGFGEASLAVWLMPTLLEEDNRAVLSLSTGSDELTIAVSRHGVALLDARQVRAEVEIQLVPRQWAFVAATFDGRGRARLSVHRPGYPDSTVFTSGALLRGGALGGTVRVGARARPDGPSGFFNGKLARPVVANLAWPEAVTAALAVGADPTTLLDRSRLCCLDFASRPAACDVPDRGELTAGATIVNLPARGVPGPFWTGSETDFRRCPAEFDAIHVHDDDLADAGWLTDLTWTVPPHLPSGVYALKLTAGSEVDRIPFVVTPGPDTPPAQVLLVLPTWTYLAYANWRTYAEHERERLEIYGERRGVDARDHWLVDHPEYGRSLYDLHRDGSGVAYSTRLRPIINLRPDYFTPTTRGFRHFAQDLHLLEWLDRRGDHYAVVTDDELEQQGESLLERYRVVLTGSHPEYCSATMLDSYLSYTCTGGRLMYLGGNGFYQVTARHPGCPAAIEVRRGQAGVATWTSDPGEEHLSATGERGGLWRMRGRAPNVLAGVGFTAQGFDAGSGYRRSPASADPAVSWVFDGITAGVGDVFGAEGPGLRGAAGDELDRADTALGTPADAVVLASSIGHSKMIALVPEEADPPYTSRPPGIHPKVRSDLVLLARPGGGAVFSVGSIAWSNAMTHKDGDNDVARVTGNVLDRFRNAPESVLSPLPTTSA